MGKRAQAEGGSLGELYSEHRTDGGRLKMQISLWCLISALLVVGIAGLLIRPRGNGFVAVLVALGLAAFLVLTIAVTRHDWRLMKRRILLYEHGLEVVDGDQRTSIPWGDIVEIYEQISIKKIYDITTDRSPRVTLVANSGFRCTIDSYVLDEQTLTPTVTDQVVAALRRQAEALLERRKGVPFGLLTVSADGIEIGAPRSASLLASLSDRFARLKGDVVTRAGRWGWSDIKSVRVAKRKKDQGSYYQVEIRARGDALPIFVSPVPESPNFAVFSDVLKALGRPLAGDD